MANNALIEIIAIQSYSITTLTLTLFITNNNGTGGADQVQTRSFLDRQITHLEHNVSYLNRVCDG